MKKGQQFILLRNSNNIVPNTIEEHRKVIDQLGYCWFGKIGIVPSARIRKAVLDEEEPRIILYTKGTAHECRLLAITEAKPGEGYPAYYDTEGILASVYFKIASIEPIEAKELDRYRIVSTGRTLSDAILRSMTSYFFAEWPDGMPKATEQKKEKVHPKKEERELLPLNDCFYRKDGKCTRKGCISYQYECERPAYCLKQKR